MRWACPNPWSKAAPALVVWPSAARASDHAWGSTAFDDDGGSARRRPRVEALTRRPSAPIGGWRWPDPATGGRAGAGPAPAAGSGAGRRRPGCRAPRGASPSGRVTSAGESVWGGRRPGPVLRGVAGHEGEADASVVQVDPGCRLEEVAAEPRGVRLDQRHAHALPVDGAQVGGVVRRSPPDGSAPSAAAEASDGLPSRASRDGASSSTPSAPSHSTSGRSLPTAVAAATRADRPGAVVGVVGQAVTLGEPGPGQRQVALRRGRDGPEVVVPDAQAERRDPLGQGPGEIVGCVLALPQRQEALAELAAVEAVAPLPGDRLQGASGARPHDALPGTVQIADSSPHRPAAVPAGSWRCRRAGERPGTPCRRSRRHGRAPARAGGGRTGRAAPATRPRNPGRSPSGRPAGRAWRRAPRRAAGRRRRRIRPDPRP